MKPLEKMSKEKIINFVNSQPIKVTKNLKKQIINLVTMKTLCNIEKELNTKMKN